MYEYRARCFNVVDGDTLDVTIDLGFRMYQEHRIRLAHVDTPERGQLLWQAAKEYVIDFCITETEGEWPLTIVTIKPKDKYGRWLAEVHCNDRDLGTELLECGLAKVYGT